MGIYEELQARGLIAQITDEEKIRNLINHGQPPCRAFYGALLDEASAASRQ